MRTCESDELGARSERSLHERRRNFTGALGLEQFHNDTFASQFQPRIHIRRIVRRVADHFIAGLPRNAVGKKREPQRSGAEQGDFIGICSDKLRTHFARLFHIAKHLGKFLRHLRRLTDMRAHRIRSASRERADCGVGKEPLVSGNRKEPLAFSFVGKKIHCAVCGGGGGGGSFFKVSSSASLVVTLYSRSTFTSLPCSS